MMEWPIRVVGLLLCFLSFNSWAAEEERPVLPTNARVIYEGGRPVGKGSVRDYSDRTIINGHVLSGGGGTRIEVGTVYPDSYYYDDDRYFHRHREDDYFRWQNRMRLEERRREAQRLSPNTNNRLYNEVVTNQRLRERREQRLDGGERPYPPPPLRPVPSGNRASFQIGW